MVEMVENSQTVQTNTNMIVFKLWVAEWRGSCERIERD